MNLRRTIGAGSFALALAFIGWILLGMFHVVPLVLQLSGESTLRTLVSAAVAFLLVAAWGFWDTYRTVYEFRKMSTASNSKRKLVNKT